MNIFLSLLLIFNFPRIDYLDSIKNCIYNNSIRKEENKKFSLSYKESYEEFFDEFI